jgi:hypothetical protein
MMNEHKVGEDFRWSAFAVRIAVSLAIFVLVLVGGELAAYLKLRYRPTRRVSEGVKTEVFKGASWTSQYFADFNASSPIRYHSYTLWRRAPFDGKTIKIDSQGLRETYYSQCEAGAPVIWMFGNSALWGAGSPDWATIPSLLAEKFSKGGQPVCIRNFGEKAWVSTQEVIALMIELKRAPQPPQAVIFYDGTTDAYLPYETSEPDVHDNFDTFRKKFEDSTASAPGFQYLRKTNTYIFLNQWMRNQGLQDPLEPVRRTSAEEASAMAKITVDNYLKNLDLVDTLASHYGFHAFYFWQPTVRAGSKPLTKNEDEMRREEESAQPGSEIVFRATYDLIAKSHRGNLFNLSNMFAEHHEPLFVETNHLGPEGNSLVADRMWQTIVNGGAIPGPRDSKGNVSLDNSGKPLHDQSPSAIAGVVSR